MKKKCVHRKLKQNLLTSVSILALAVGIAAGTYGVYISKTKQSNDNAPMVLSPVQVVTFQNDTLYMGTPAVMYYIPGKIVRNYVENANSYHMQLPYFSHEKWHEHNNKYAYKVSPLEYYKLRIWNEITANYAAIETALLEIKTADDPLKIMAKYENTYMKFFIKAIKNGKIDPFSQSRFDQFKVQRFIAVGTAKMWMQSFQKTYSSAHNKMLKSYLQRTGFSVSHPHTYKRILSYMCTIGGVDLSKLLNADINYMDNQLYVLDKIPYVHSLVKDSNIKIILAEDCFNNLPLLKKNSIKGKKSAFQHIFIAAKLKYEIYKLEKSNIPLTQSVISACYNKVMLELANDKTFFEFVREYEKTIISSYVYDSNRDSEFSTDTLSNNDKAIIAKFYKYKGTDLLDYLNTFDAEKTPVKNNFTFENLFPVLNIPLLFNDHSYDVNTLFEDAKLMPSGEDVLQKKENSSIPATVNSPVKPRRLSTDLYIQLPNFEENILCDKAMSTQQLQEISNLFKSFEAIPTVFRSTNTEKQEEYRKNHPDEKCNYFEENPKIIVTQTKEKAPSKFPSLFIKNYFPHSSKE